MKRHRISIFSRVTMMAAVIGVLTVAGVASAQDGEGLSTETFSPSTSSGALFELSLPRVKEHLEWHIGGLVHYSHQPVRRVVVNTVTDELVEESYPLDSRLTADLFVALGLFGFAEIGLAIPIIAFQDGQGGVPGGNIQSAGLGDPRLELKARIAESKGFGLGAGATITAPLGHYASSGTDFMGSQLPTVEPRIMGSYTAGRVTTGLNIGYLIRGEESLGTGDEAYEQRSALTWNAGLAFDVVDFYDPGGFRIALEANSEVGQNFDTITETPIEVLVGGKYRTKKDLVISAGGGPGASTAVGTPVFRVFAGLAWDPIYRPVTHCPAGPEDLDGFEDDDDCVDPDNDQDTLLDLFDKCPNEPEDFDKFEDEDGCPDLDNDGDKIPDKLDKCPMISEDFDEFEDDDGCPEEGPAKPQVKITDTQILISSKIYFDFDKATIKEVSYPILDAVADEMVKNPGIKKVQIDGHTDNEGTNQYNMELSEERAKSVMEYLIGKGVNPERLTHKGFGFTKPKASNETEEGKAINRRVEFTILEKE